MIAYSELDLWAGVLVLAGGVVGLLCQAFIIIIRFPYPTRSIERFDELTAVVLSYLV
jgi:hypothetical protein